MKKALSLVLALIMCLGCFVFADCGTEMGSAIRATGSNLKTIMITHNMADVIRVGNRLIMMHEGRIVVDVKGEEKKKLTIDQLLQMFEASSGSQFTSDKVMLSTN